MSAFKKGMTSTAIRPALTEKRTSSQSRGVIGRQSRRALLGSPHASYIPSERIAYDIVPVPALPALDSWRRPGHPLGSLTSRSHT